LGLGAFASPKVRAEVGKRVALCAFEVASNPETQRQTADGYVAIWSRLKSVTDAVARAVIDDLDTQAFLYQPSEKHPRTFKR
jgi:hypothetical protein